jgi:hypothetical protein
MSLVPKRCSNFAVPMKRGAGREIELASLPRNGMIVFEVPVPSADGNTPMNAMGISLDHVRIEPSMSRLKAASHAKKGPAGQGGAKVGTVRSSGLLSCALTRWLVLQDRRLLPRAWPKSRYPRLHGGPPLAGRSKPTCRGDTLLCRFPARAPPVPGCEGTAPSPINICINCGAIVVLIYVKLLLPIGSLMPKKSAPGGVAARGVTLPMRTSDFVSTIA